MFNSLINKLGLLTLFCLLTCWGCRSDDDDFGPPASQDCLAMEGETVINMHSTIDFSCPITNRSTMINKYSYQYAVFNPNDQNQIAFMRALENTFNGCNKEIWTYDFCTESLEYVCNTGCIYLDWSTKGWLVFMATDKNIWKVKANGDSLTQLTFEVNSPQIAATWNPSGDKIVFYNTATEIRHAQIIDEDGNQLETISLLGSQNYKWIGDKIISTFDYHQVEDSVVIAIYDVNTEQLVFVEGFDFENEPSFVTLLEDGNILYRNITETAILDPATGEKERLLYNARNRTYFMMNISPDERYLITMRSNFVAITGFCRFELDQGFYLYDRVTGEERRLTLPEE